MGRNQPALARIQSAGTDGPRPSDLDLNQVYRDFVDFVSRTLMCHGVPLPNLDDAVQDVFLVVHHRKASFDRAAAQLRVQQLAR